MTVESQTTKVSANGNGVATVFSFSPLVIFESTDLTVTKVGTDGTETVLSEGSGTSDYSVSVSSYPGTGSITFPASGSTKLAVGESLVMKRVLVLEQTTDLENQGGYFADTQETALDRLCMVDLQQQEEIDRALKIPVSDAAGITVTLPAAADRAGLNLIFDGDGNITAGAGAADANVSAAMVPVVEAATLAAGRTELGATSVGEALFTAASATAARSAMTAAKAEAGSGLSLASDVLSLASFRGALVYRSTNQSLASATVTPISFDTEVYDTDGLWSSGAATKFIIPAGVSKVRLSGAVTFAGATTNVRECYFYKNGAAFAGSFEDRRGQLGAGTNVKTGCWSAVVSVVEGDYFELNAYQDSGGAINALGGSSALWMSIEIVR